MPNSLVICLDANLVIRRVTDPLSATIHELWTGWEAQRSQLAAPRLLYYEVVNALHRMHHHHVWSEAAGRDALRAALALPIRLHDELELHEQAMTFAARFHLAAAYDAHYLALADRLGAEFWTTDRRLYNNVSRELPWVELVDV